jgi:hypothetical protein
LLREKAEEGKDYIKRRSVDLKESAGDLIDRGKQAIERQRGSFSAAVEAGRQAYRENVEAPPQQAAGEPVEGV